jgi:hypothetical protein
LPKLEKTKKIQIEGSRNLEMNKNNLKNLHAQKVFWKQNSKIALCWAFYWVNDKKIKCNNFSNYALYSLS